MIDKESEAIALIQGTGYRVREEGNGVFAILPPATKKKPVWQWLSSKIFAQATDAPAMFVLKTRESMSYGYLAVPNPNWVLEIKQSKYLPAAQEIIFVLDDVNKTILKYV